MPNTVTPSPPRPVRRTSLAARGEPLMWLTGLALLIATSLIITLVVKVAYEGAQTFWPRPIELVRVRADATENSGRVFLGIPISDEPFDPAPHAALRFRALRESGSAPASAFAPDGRPIRRQYRVGNREVNEVPFVWVALAEAQSIERPADAVMLERLNWGVWLGTPTAALRQTRVTLAPSDTLIADDIKDSNGIQTRITRRLVGTSEHAERIVEQREYLAQGAATWEAFDTLHAQATARLREARHIDAVEIAEINASINRAQLSLRAAHLRLATRDSPGLKAGLWSALIGVAIALSAAWMVLARRPRPPSDSARLARSLLLRALCVASIVAWSATCLERPWARQPLTPDGLARVEAATKEHIESLEREYASAIARKTALDAQDDSYRIEFIDGAGTSVAPISQSSLDQPMRISQIVRAVRANSLSFAGKLSVYLSRWGEFLSSDPRESNTDGGVFPVIFGTVLMTLLLSVLVVPLGVIAALYLREYARQGPVTSILRISINNLAGVPSIVFGMFGLGFFCYTLGKYIDTGPPPGDRFNKQAWWAWAFAGALLVLGAFAGAILARPAPGKHAQRRHRVLAALGTLVWIGAAGVFVLLLIHTPYFGGFFAAKPAATFGTRGLLWASLTLALLTLPVVIVATEEAIAAVPRTMREGSYGCGASKWQTIRRIVLPAAMPGIMTGMILAMARGAGEVAPLMLVGAMKVAPELPVSLRFPFLHAERSFMHLGFHIFDLGFQSPDSAAARPLVWTTTLLLIAIVMFLNLAAIIIRARLRSRSRSSAI